MSTSAVAAVERTTASALGAREPTSAANVLMSFASGIHANTDALYDDGDLGVVARFAGSLDDGDG